MFAAVFATVYAAHHVGDQWVQTRHQALTKGSPGWVGRRACLGHVASYTLTAVVMLAVVALVLDLDVTVGGVAAGQAVSAATHYWADRRTTLRALAERLGHGDYYQVGMPRPGLPGVVSDSGEAVAFDNLTTGTGAFHLDQSWHLFWLLVTALVTVAV